jgi:hypothetical protein
MCVVRRGIDERDHRDLTGIGGCCARPSTGHALDAATLPGSVTNRAFASLASGLGRSRLQRKIAIWSRREDAVARGHHGEKHE